MSTTVKVLFEDCSKFLFAFNFARENVNRNYNFHEAGGTDCITPSTLNFSKNSLKFIFHSFPLKKYSKMHLQIISHHHYFSNRHNILSNISTKNASKITLIVALHFCFFFLQPAAFLYEMEKNWLLKNSANENRTK